MSAAPTEADPPHGRAAAVLPGAAPVAPGADRLLAPLTTLRVGGPARRLLVAGEPASLVDAVQEVDAAGEPLLLVAGGSNLVVSDEGFDGTAVHITPVGGNGGAALAAVSVEPARDGAGVAVQVPAGVPWDTLVELSVASGWSGLEALSGIPGSTGATPVQNVGAYGAEVADTVVRVRVYDRITRETRWLTAAECGFGYRDSALKRAAAAGPGGTDRFVVLEVRFRLESSGQSAPVRYAQLADRLGVSPGQRAPLAAVREAVLELRCSKGMVLDDADHDTWSVGSFFTNPVLDAERAASLPPDAPRWPAGAGRVKVPAAWLIERAGISRGHGLPGPAAVSTRHTLAVTNRGSARAADIVALARELRDAVADTFGVTLVPEPRLVGLAL